MENIADFFSFPVKNDKLPGRNCVSALFPVAQASRLWGRTPGWARP